MYLILGKTRFCTFIIARNDVLSCFNQISTPMVCLAFLWGGVGRGRMSFWFLFGFFCGLFLSQRLPHHTEHPWDALPACRTEQAGAQAVPPALAIAGSGCGEAPQSCGSLNKYPEEGPAAAQFQGRHMKGCAGSYWKAWCVKWDIFCLQSVAQQAGGIHEAAEAGRGTSEHSSRNTSTNSSAASVQATEWADCRRTLQTPSCDSCRKRRHV